ncbi:MAG: hypothetical protein PHQ43_14825 [Dehalococcoidales bacterium]|nr:hypothetical protein [Dehalococcoidales bacterium]
MSQRIIYKCDRCGATAETQEERNALDIRLVGIGTLKYVEGKTYLLDDLLRHTDMCRLCRQDLGIDSEGGKTVLIQTPPLDGVIREIVRSEIEQ